MTSSRPHVLLWMLTMSCGHPQLVPRPATSPPIAEQTQSPPEAARQRLSFDIVVPYPATVLYALDAASEVPHHAPGYPEWLFEGASEPPWLTAYATRRRSEWGHQVDDGDGYYAPFTECSYNTGDTGALLECLSAILDGADLSVARTAIHEADRRIRRRWDLLRPRLEDCSRGLRDLTTSPAGKELTEVLANASMLPDSAELSFRVILVAKPQGDHTYAHHEGRYLVLEVPEEQAPASKIDVLFHEVAHLASYHAPNRGAMEQSFVGKGYEGLVAANLWWEAFATAFGNGLVAARLDPTFCYRESMYDDDAVDAVGRALYLRWRLGGAVRIEPAFAERLIEVTRASWPQGRWRVQDVFVRVLSFSDTHEAEAAFRAGVRSSSWSGHTPIPDDLTRPEGMPPTTPRIVFATTDTLRDRSDVLELFDLDLRSIESRLASSGPSLFWSEDAHGIPLILITAASRDELVTAARRFGESTPISHRGWTRLSPS